MSRIRLQKLASLLGLLAILMSTLAPSVSQTLIAHHRLGNALTPDIYTVAWVPSPPTAIARRGIARSR